MNICFYAPFKPLDHPDPSGDQVIGAGLFEYLAGQGNKLRTVSNLRCRWIYWKPWLLPQIVREHQRAKRWVDLNRPDLWLTYHTYYKGPDILGPTICGKTGLPYVIFQGVYATKRRRTLKTWPGFVLNRNALLASKHVFTNKRKDFTNLKRIIPAERLTYVPPGIFPERFSFNDNARSSLRRSWNVGDAPVVLAAAMFRSDVKTVGLSMLIKACGRLLKRRKRFYLIIAGDGEEKDRLLKLAQTHLPGSTRFIGRVPRDEMHRFYSAGDLFAFPGIRESLGMVYLEAQSCGVPAIAFANEGTPQVIKHLETGLLVPAFDEASFAGAIETLLEETSLRIKMGEAARKYVRNHHDLNKNYKIVEAVLKTVVHGR
jgi:glycosyltransferase involved in cell wall biosynthesis